MHVFVLTSNISRPQASRITVSNEAAALLREQLPGDSGLVLSSRGEVAIKGKGSRQHNNNIWMRLTHPRLFLSHPSGAMHVHFLEGAPSAAHQPWRASPVRGAPRSASPRGSREASTASAAARSPPRGGSPRHGGGRPLPGRPFASEAALDTLGERGASPVVANATL